MKKEWQFLLSHYRSGVLTQRVVNRKLRVVWNWNFSSSGQHYHGWEIAVILRNFRKTKLSKSNFFFFFTLFQHVQYATRRLSLCDIRKYHFPAFYGTSARQAAIFFWYTHDTNMEFLQQSLEFVAETRILAEMKIENRGKNFYLWKNKLTSILFFFKQSVGVAESCQQNRASMELSFMDICIF